VGCRAQPWPQTHFGASKDTSGDNNDDSSGLLLNLCYFNLFGRYNDHKSPPLAHFNRAHLSQW